MKKRRKKFKKKSEPKKPHAQSELKLSAPAPILEPLNRPIAALEAPVPKAFWGRTTFKWARRIGAFIIGPVLAVVGFICAIWGPPWPTAPTFDPGFPSFGSPLDVPFNVTNKSAIFPVYDLTILCAVEGFTGKDALGGMTYLNNVGASEAVKGQTLGPLKTRSYVCPLKRLIRILPEPKIEKVTIGFVSTYNSPWPWGGTSKSISDRFTLNATTVPPQWTRGTPLR